MLGSHGVVIAFILSSVTGDLSGFLLYPRECRHHRSNFLSLDYITAATLLLVAVNSLSFIVEENPRLLPPDCFGLSPTVVTLSVEL